MELYLVRHAVAELRDPLRWPDDAERPLAARGQRRFRRAATGLGRLQPAVDALLTSPYARARETAELLASEAGWPPPLVLAALAPGHHPEQLVEEVGRVALTAASSLALVGHEPDLHQLASYLLAGAVSALSLEWRRGGVARLDYQGRPRPGAATLAWYLPPKVLRRVAR